jgi:hypothetical protein
MTVQANVPALSQHCHCHQHSEGEAVVRNIDQYVSMIKDITYTNIADVMNNGRAVIDIENCGMRYKLQAL